MNTKLRPARSVDWLAVARLLIETRAKFMPYAPSAHSDDEVTRWVSQELIPEGGVSVACRDGEVVGVVAVETEEEIGGSWIRQMAVDPSLVGRGIGSKMLVHVLRTLPFPVRLYTFQANEGARRFYERHGFVATAFGDGSDNEEGVPDVLYVRAESMSEEQPEA